MLNITIYCIYSVSPLSKKFGELKHHMCITMKFIITSILYAIHL